MKKTIAILLTGATVLTGTAGLVGCGQNTEVVQEETKEGNHNQEKVYKLGDTVSTDCLECTVKSVEKVETYNDTCIIKVESDFKNICKETVDRFIPVGDSLETRQISNLITIDYNNGYVFSESPLYYYGGRSYDFSSGENLSDLMVLGPEKKITKYIEVPTEVWENVEAPLLVKVYLIKLREPNATVFTYKIR